MSVHEKLRYARERVGLTLSQVHDRTKIGQSSLSEFERGIRSPKLHHLATLAKLYHRSAAFFLSSEPIEREVVLWRERPSEKPEEIERLFLRHCEQFHNLEVWCEEPAPHDLPEEHGDPASYSYAKAENLARRVKGELYLGDQPGQNLLRVLEEVCAVKVFHLPFKPSGTAASARSDSFGCAALLNSTNVRWRRNFDLAHELFHLLTWHMFRSGTSTESTEPGKQEERFANCFARNLLIPPGPLRIAVNRRGKITAESLPDIARQFDVSIDALGWQVHYVFQRQLEETERLIEQTRSLIVPKERASTAPPKWPERYRSLAVKALRRGEMSTGRFAEYIGISRQRAMKYLGGETRSDEEIPITPP